MTNEISLPKPGTTRSPSNDSPANAANQNSLPKPGMTCLSMCPPSTNRPSNAATHQSLPKPGTTCLPTCPPSNDGPAYADTQTYVHKTQKYLPKTSTTCLPTCPPRNTGPNNVATQKSLTKTGTTRFPSRVTLATATDKIPQHWSDYTTELIGQAETVEARRKLAEEIIGDAATKPVDIKRLVVPRWRSKMHPAAPLLTQYSTTG